MNCIFFSHSFQLQLSRCFAMNNVAKSIYNSQFTTHNVLKSFHSIAG